MVEPILKNFFSENFPLVFSFLLLSSILAKLSVDIDKILLGAGSGIISTSSFGLAPTICGNFGQEEALSLFSFSLTTGHSPLIEFRGFLRNRPFSSGGLGALRLLEICAATSDVSEFCLVNSLCVSLTCGSVENVVNTWLLASRWSVTTGFLISTVLGLEAILGF